MIKILKVWVETDVPGIHLLNDNGWKVGTGKMSDGEEVFMMEIKKGEEIKEKENK